MSLLREFCLYILARCLDRPAATLNELQGARVGRVAKVGAMRAKIQRKLLLEAVHTLTIANESARRVANLTPGPVSPAPRWTFAS